MTVHSRRWRAPTLGLLGLALIVAVVEVLPRLDIVDRRFLPPFSAMAASLGDQLGQGDFWVALGQALRGWALGLAIAMLAGTVFGVLIGSVPLLRAATASMIEFVRPIPSVALIPLVVLIYGSKLESALVLVVYAAFWQVLVQVLYGVADVDPVVLEITAELVIGVPGLGKSIGVAQSSGAVASTYALVIVVGVIGVLVNASARAVERRVLRWHTSVRGDL